MKILNESFEKKTGGIRSLDDLIVMREQTNNEIDHIFSKYDSRCEEIKVR